MSASKKAFLTGLLAATGNYTIKDKKQPFVIDKLFLDAFKGWVLAGLSKEESAYKICKSHPEASKLSANERKRWQRQLIETSNEE